MSKSALVGGMIAALVMVGSTPALAQDESSDRAAYEASLRCFVVAGHASAERKRAGDADRAATYEAKAHASFDAAMRFGKSLGLTGQQMTDDFQAAQNRELRRLLTDDEYNREAAADCRALGLL